ncbi:MAG: DEAD/DEAH box helicase [Deltaproteobacteria bacterium]|nr:DEAD/DEAH box helicase [Deltaproteobacteria bacterium]
MESAGEAEMIPSILSQQLKQGVEDFLKTTFPVSTPFFHGVVDDLLSEDDKVFKGPYLSVQLPFKKGSGRPDYFIDVPMSFSPHLHQEHTFERLSGEKPKSTIVATGTGSGKTESFLYPVLNFCYQHRGESGIKAIFIYPMNALATDQAGRLAKAIYDNPKLKGMVTAGLYVGQSEKDPHMVMGQDFIITHKETLRTNPPDILLTNYKMLDYLLIRAKDYPLWSQAVPETLQFLVVDELHTFDGAQGSDLACLVRRLKARLNTPKDFLCCIGTSATLGSEEQKDCLVEYAREVFGEPFDENAVITESRISPGEFLEKSMITRVDLVAPDLMDRLNPEVYDNFKAYALMQYQLWFDEILLEKDFKDMEWRFELSEKLKGHSFFQNLLKVLKGESKSYGDILFELEKCTADLKSLAPAHKINLFASLLALVSIARIKINDTVFSFLNVRYQHWMRELRRMVGEVSAKPCINFADDLNEEQLKKHLPLIHCRDCNSMGWAGLKREMDNEINPDLQSFYIAFFKNDPKVTFIFPEKKNPTQFFMDGLFDSLCTDCLHLVSGSNKNDCKNCGGSSMIHVFIPNTKTRRNDRIFGTHNCPYCGGYNSLTILGSRAASLTSVLIAQLYSSTFNDDKKLLTFSDSVQDAAHRAGFFEGRTFRFNFRGALQHFIEDTKEISLDQVSGKFIRYWSDKMNENRFISTFLAPNMAWLPDYAKLKKDGILPKGSDLKHQVHKRIEWEIYSEYGFRTRIGRTLEKTSSSIAHANPALLDAMSQKLLGILKNEIGGFEKLNTKSVKLFLSGFLTHLKNRGGLYYTELDAFIERWGEPYIINRIPWMPNFSINARTPAFLTVKQSYRFDQIFSKKNSRMTWYEFWADKCFSPFYPLVGELIRSIYEFILKSLVDDKILYEHKINNEPVWGIYPKSFNVSKNVIQFTCRECSHNLSVSLQEQTFWENAYCIRQNCPGTYTLMDTEPDYYGKLYASGDIERIFAAEHTGLLERDVKETLERDFKRKDRNPWDPNLLSCTPTLEMGIDIGDLSSIILCSVPPAQANYLQRIGRAGRENGNSLNYTVANASPHDLYFFADPKTMISGQIDPPGIFLNASAVLERQFTAFCFDQWVESGISENAIPQQLRHVLSNLEPVDINKFPHSFLSFIETRQTIILDDFIKLFPKTLTPESILFLEKFARGNDENEGSLAYRIIEQLTYHYRARESLKKKVNALNAKIRKKKKEKAKDKNYEKELGELIIEKKGLHSLVTRINDKHTLNFFTDEGLLPNYAFPQAGVMLRSIIHRRKAKIQEQGSNYDIFTYDFERPAVSAISELAPASTFYAGGRKVVIDQVDLSVSEVEMWRLCDKCSFMAIEGTLSEYSSCPQCGSPLWSDAGQKRNMLRMQQMFATTSDKDSRISDDNDERNTSFFNKQMVVGFKETDITDAYKVKTDDLPFGFEFLSKANFREINFGEKEEIGEKVSIAGLELPRKGFLICKYCGKIQNRKGEIKHSLTCPSRKKDSEKNLADCVYLYREFASEAIMMLLPIISLESSDKKLHSFIAALHLGLKQMFGGNIDHIQTALHEEPVADSSHRKQFIVIYDTVPGGTGYLKQLMRSKKPLMIVFEKALEVLKSCSCNQNPEKDGCYKCLFAYRRSYTMSGTSRDTAIEILSEILKCKDLLIQTKTLKDIKINSLFDSVLEARFIEALRRVKKENLPVSLKKEVVNGKPGYFYKIGDRAWYIELQVDLGQPDGVLVKSRADFVFRPARARDGLQPIAVFTDGFTFHKDRIGKDMHQRCAIAQSNNFYVWSLSWKDIENQYKNQNSFFENYTHIQKEEKILKYNQLTELYEIKNLRKTNNIDSFEWLIRFLVNPDAEKWSCHAFIHGLIHLDNVTYGTSEGESKWFENLETRFPVEVNEIIKDAFEVKQDQWFYGLSQPKLKNSFLQISIAVQKDAIQTNKASEMYIACRLEDLDEFQEKKEFEAAWNGFLRLYNLFQFIPHSYFITGQDMANGVAYKGFRDTEPEDVSGTKSEWDEVLELIDPAFHKLIKQLAEMNCPVPEAGFEFVDEKGQIIAEAELGWIEKRVAFLLSHQIEFTSIFQQAGWKVAMIDDVLNNKAEYIDLLSD